MRRRFRRLGEDDEFVFECVNCEMLGSIRTSAWEAVGFSQEPGERSGIKRSLAIIWIVSIRVIVKITEWTFLKGNVLVESKREQILGINHIYGTERGRGILEKIILSNSYVPAIVLDGGGTKKTGAHILPWKYQQFV